MDAGTEAVDRLTTSIDDLKATIQDAQTAGVSRLTLANVVELATLRTHSLLEAFLEEIFYLALLKDASVPSNGAVVEVRSREEAELLVLSSGTRREKYLSWLPLDRTLDIAQSYLRDGHTFERLRYRNTEKRAIAELVTVRNAIAHPSDYAFEQFVELAKQKSYPSTRAADYLLSTRGGAFEVLLLMTQAEVLARGLLAPTDTAAALVLQPEADFQATQNAPAGNYECLRCAVLISLPNRGKPGPCPNCETVSACIHCGNVPAAKSKWRRLVTD